MAMPGKTIRTLDDLFVHTLQDIYYAERQIIKHLPGMIKKASNPQLKTAFEDHLKETEGQVERLKQVFEMNGLKPKAVTCEAMDGILSEAKEIMGDCADESVRDAAIISAAQAVEHYEMTRYGTLIAFAEQLGHSECAALLRETLDEEKAADTKLSAIAEPRSIAWPPDQAGGRRPGAAASCRLRGGGTSFRNARPAKAEMTEAVSTASLIPA